MGVGHGARGELMSGVEAWECKGRSCGDSLTVWNIKKTYGGFRPAGLGLGSSRGVLPQAKKTVYDKRVVISS